MMNRYDPLGGGFLRLGRRDAGEQVCRLWWSGSGVRTKVCCDRLEAEFAVPEADTHTPWVAVTVDGMFGLDLSGASAIIRDAQLSGDLYLGVIRNSPRKEEALSYINYLIS